jgi:hypothetical protein
MIAIDAVDEMLVDEPFPVSANPEKCLRVPKILTRSFPEILATCR